MENRIHTGPILLQNFGHEHSTIHIKLPFRQRGMTHEQSNTSPAPLQSHHHEQHPRPNDQEHHSIPADKSIWHLHRRLYNWMLTWAHSPYGTWALGFISFIESSFFPIPPDPLLLALCAGKPKRSFWYAFVCSVTSVLGGLFGYLIGFALYETVGKLIIATLGMQAAFAQVGILYADNAFLAVLTAAFTPIPYKVFTIAAGVWHISIPVFIAASVIGRSGRFFIEGSLLYFFGARVRTLAEKYFDWVAWGVLILIIVGFIALRMIS